MSRAYCASEFVAPRYPVVPIGNGFHCDAVLLCFVFFDSTHAASFSFRQQCREAVGAQGSRAPTGYSLLYASNFFTTPGRVKNISPTRG